MHCTTDHLFRNNFFCSCYRMQRRKKNQRTLCQSAIALWQRASTYRTSGTIIKNKHTLIKFHFVHDLLNVCTYRFQVCILRNGIQLKNSPKGLRKGKFKSNRLLIYFRTFHKSKILRKNMDDGRVGTSKAEAIHSFWDENNWELIKDHFWKTAQATNLNFTKLNKRRRDISRKVTC